MRIREILSCSSKEKKIFCSQFFNFGAQRILEYAKLEGTHQDDQIQLLDWCRTLQESHCVFKSIVQMLLPCPAGEAVPNEPFWFFFWFFFNLVNSNIL